MYVTRELNRFQFRCKLGFRAEFPNRSSNYTISAFGMPRYDDRHGNTTRLYVGHLSSRTRSRDLEHIFSRYGRASVMHCQYLSNDGLIVSGNHFRRVRDVDMKQDFAFVDFSDPRDADDARYSLNGRDVDGRRIVVELARGVPRGPGGVREYLGRAPPPGSGRCFNCGLDGHWARDCKSGDWKNKCYRCGERGHIERNCKNSPKKGSYSRSPVRSRSPRRGRGRRSYSRSRSRSYSRSVSPRGRGRAIDRSVSPPARGRAIDRSVSPPARGRAVDRSISPPVRGRAVDRSVSPPPRGRSINRSLSPPPGERSIDREGLRSRSPYHGSPDAASPPRFRKHSPSPDDGDIQGRESPSPKRERLVKDDDNDSRSPPRMRNRSPVGYEKGDEPFESNGVSRSPSPIRDDRSPMDDEDEQKPPSGSESP